MKQVILDTSFILAAVKQKIDFFERLSLKGMRIIIPDQTMRELKGLGAKLELKIIENNKFELVIIPGKDADSAIINFARKNPEAIVATLDAGLKKKIRNKKLIIRQKKKLEII